MFYVVLTNSWKLVHCINGGA